MLALTDCFRSIGGTTAPTYVLEDLCVLSMVTNAQQIPEVMTYLNDAVQRGQVLYLAISVRA
jgi:hypothetical protein